uniref:Uncharacterized protein n=1 Tax=Siphoviridae sp. ctDmQ3 TaxID=2823570 RepID=A0A8S5L834_9CAUD|nr:MAG TPA: hypothetical protein [Siphoviridae sp. ctDmQ3]
MIYFYTQTRKWVSISLDLYHIKQKWVSIS